MKKKFQKYLLAFSDLVFALFFFWFALSYLTHGRYAWVSLLNMFAFQLFLFLIPIVLFGFFQKIRRIQISSIIVLILFIFTFGKFFVPKQKTILESEDVLKVMTYNMLVFTPDVLSIADVFREENADIVMMQETSIEMAEYLETEMRGTYPYQIHFPSDIPLGISVISKYPFEVIDYDMGKSWVGEPILLDLNWNGQIIHVVNFHMQPTTTEVFLNFELLGKRSESRRRHANKIDKFLYEHPGPSIVAGDANDVFLNDAYVTLINSGLQDAWIEAGFGLGHTFPGNKSPGSSRPQINGIYVPEWLVRIDYIFATYDWEVLSAYNARTDGYSDHRGVVAILRLK